MNSKAVAGLTAGALAVGLLVGLVVGSDDNDGTNSVSGPGPRRAEAGVPVGYERAQGGAVAAAAAYAEAVGSMALLSRESREAALAAMSAPNVLDDIKEAMEPGLDVLAEGLDANGAGGAVVRAAPLAYRIREYTNDSATVELWTVAVVGTARTLTPTSSWGITRVELRWVAGDWKLAGLLEQREGPTPQQAGKPTAAQDLVTSVKDFRSFHHVPAQ